jgi:hypothetical protein
VTITTELAAALAGGISLADVGSDYRLWVINAGNVGLVSRAIRVR